MFNTQNQATFYAIITLFRATFHAITTLFRATFVGKVTSFIFISDKNLIVFSQLYKIA